jgi:hypothetical protein
MFSLLLVLQESGVCVLVDAVDQLEELGVLSILVRVGVDLELDYVVKLVLDADLLGNNFFKLILALLVSC